MSCNLRQRKDDIPKLTKKEKSWFCPDCNTLLFAERKPTCRKAMLAKMEALHAFAEVEDIELNVR